MNQETTHIITHALSRKACVRAQDAHPQVLNLRGDWSVVSFGMLRTVTIQGDPGSGG